MSRLLQMTLIMWLALGWYSCFLIWIISMFYHWVLFFLFLFCMIGQLKYPSSALNSFEKIINYPKKQEDSNVSGLWWDSFSNCWWSWPCSDVWCYNKLLLISSMCKEFLPSLSNPMLILNLNNLLSDVINYKRSCKRISRQQSLVEVAMTRYLRESCVPTILH